MSNKTVEGKIRDLALARDPKTGEWLYGRRAIKKLIPQVTEWKIRNILQESRDPTVAQKLQQEVDVLSIPQIVVKTPKLKKAAKPKKTGLETWVIGSDFHAPYQHEPSCALFYQIVGDLNPERVVLLGDVITLDAYSRYDKAPEHPNHWIHDIKQAGKILSSVKQAAPEAQLDWVVGNHEDRLRRYLMKHDPLLYEVLDLKKLFYLTDEQDKLLDWNYINDTEIFEEDLNLILAHGYMVRKHTAYTAKGHVENLLMSVIIGHCHRLGIYKKNNARSRYLGEQALFGIENGCLCNYDQDYTDGRTNDWQHGFSVLTIDRSASFVSQELVEINNKQTIFRGKQYKA